MRSACLLTFIVLPFLLFSQPTQPPASADSLAKYSYLLMAYKFNGDTLGNSTCFFLRDGKKLYLVTAFHALTGCPMNPEDSQRSYERIEKINVLYDTTAGKRRFKNVPLGEYIDTPCFSFTDSADLGFIDVTKKFRKISVNAIERPIEKEQDSIASGDTILIFGYSEADRIIFFSTHKLKHTGTIHRPQALPHAFNDYPEVPKLYISYDSVVKRGVSGSPVFIVSRDTTHRPSIKFAGIQSQSHDSLNNSLGVKASLLFKAIDQRK